jgi:hypothetical protein
MWPAVTKIVPTPKLGTAYGFMFSVQNIGLFIFPMLIGWVVDTSNPNYRTVVNQERFEIIQDENMNYSGSYINRKNEPVTNKEINVTTVVFEDVIGGDIVWKGSHSTTTNDQGEFDIKVGDPDVILDVDFSKLRETKQYESYRAELVLKENDAEEVIFNGDFNTDENNIFVSVIDAKDAELLGKTHRGTIKVYSVIDFEDDDGEVRSEQIVERVWEESTRFYIDEAGQFEVIMGQGSPDHASGDYFGLTSESYSLEIIKPLDYTNPMLVFSLLGIFGLVFAFLLKREDKTSGYGLELPNKVKEEEKES